MDHLAGVADYLDGREGPRGFSEQQYPHQALTGKIIASSYTVQRAFGFGLAESVYRRALVVELQYLGVTVAQEVPYELFHRGVSVGYYRADLVVESSLMIETKTGLVRDPNAARQLLNCMCAARLSLGLVVYFGPRGVTIKRVIASHSAREDRP